MNTDLKVPETVIINREKDKVNFEKNKIENQPQITTPQNPIEVTPKKTFREKYLRKILITFISIFTIFTIIFGTIVVATFTNLDVQIFGITLQGRITDQTTGVPIENAVIYIDGIEKTKSDSKGFYSIQNLKLGTVEIKVKEQKYIELIQTIQINRLFLNLTTTRDIVLIPQEKAVITGKFVVDNKDYRFTQEKVLLDEKEFKINSDGSFKFEGITVGDQKLVLYSDSYNDYVSNFEIKVGINTLKEISLQPSGEVEGSLKSYVSEDIVTNIEFFGEGIIKDKIEFRGDLFRLKDLDIGKEYSIRAEAKGYLTREYKIKVNQGLNTFFNFKIVEDAKFIQYIKDAQTNRSQFFVMDLDGANKKRVSNFNNNVDIKGFKFISEENSIYFQSNKDRITNLNTTLDLIYKIDINTGTETRITTQVNDLTQIIPFYSQKKLVTYKRVGSGSNSKLALWFGDIDGKNMRKLNLETSKAYKTILLSKDSRYLYISDSFANVAGAVSGSNQTPTFITKYSLTDNTSTEVESGDNISLFTLSNDGEKFLYDVSNQETKFLDLYFKNETNKEKRLINDNHDGRRYQFLNDNNFIYISKIDGRESIRKYDPQSFKEDKIIETSIGETISDLYFQGNYLYYVINNKTYILDVSKPSSFKLVSDII